MSEIVAGPLRSRYGAKMCKLCQRGISIGAMVSKVAASGKTTQHGQGPGMWVHSYCAVSPIASADNVSVQKVLFE